MRRQRPRYARHRTLRVHLGAGQHGAAQHLGQGQRRDMARTQQDGNLGGHVDDGRFDADFAGPAVQHQRHRIAELVGHVSRGGRTDPAEAIGRRRRQPAAEGGQHGLRGRMRGAAQAHRILSARDGIQHAGGAREYQRQRSRPERIHQPAGGIGNTRGPARQVGARRDMHDDGMVVGPALGGKDACDRRRIRGVRGQAIDGLGGQAHQLSGPQQGHRLRDGLGRGRQDARAHAATDRRCRAPPPPARRCARPAPGRCPGRSRGPSCGRAAPRPCHTGAVWR